MISQLASLLMGKYTDMTMEQALDEVFKSDTYPHVLNESTKLYGKSIILCKNKITF